MPPSDEGGTDDFKRTRSSAGRLHGWRHILRKPFKRKDNKSEAGLPGSATAVTDTELDTLGDQALNPEDSSILGPLRSALPLTGVDDITTSTSNDDLTRLQKETSLWIHIKWAHHIRDELEKCIQDMGITVDILQKILTLRELKRPQEVLQPKSTPSLTSRKAPRDQEWIKDLHLALGRLQKQSPHPPRTLSLALLEDGVELWEQAKEDQPDLHLQENGMMVWLQLEDKDQPALSTFLMIETTDAWSSKAYSAAPLPTLADLSQPSPSTAETENRSYFQTWGTLPSLRDSPLTHTVFAETSQWQRKFTLRDIVQRPDAATMLTRRTLTALTQQLLLGYRRLMLLTYTCSNLRSDNIAYYRPAGTEIDLTDPDWLLHPYMTCGFGSSAPERRPGVQSGPLKDPEAAIVEIGLVLFQLGSQRVVEYDTRTAKVMLPTLRRAKREALNSLNVVEGSHGAKFADVVSACLQAKASNALDVTEAALATLTGLKDEIDGADEVTWYSEDIEIIDVEKAEEKKYVEKDGMGKAEVSKVEVGKDEVEKAEGLR